MNPLIGADKPFVIILASVKVLGVTFYRERWEFRATVEQSTPFDFTVTPLTPTLRIRGEWWRRLGYVVLAPLSRWIASND